MTDDARSLVERWFLSPPRAPGDAGPRPLPAEHERKVREIEAYGDQFEAAAFLRGRAAGKNEAALEAVYGSFDAKVQADVATARRDARVAAIEEAAQVVEEHSKAPKGITWGKLKTAIRALAADLPDNS